MLVCILKKIECTKPQRTLVGAWGMSAVVLKMDATGGHEPTLQLFTGVEGMRLILISTGLPLICVCYTNFSRPSGVGKGTHFCPPLPTNLFRDPSASSFKIILPQE